MVFDGPNQSHQSNQEKKDSYCHRDSNNSETGDQAKANAPSCNSNQQQTDQLVRKRKREEKFWSHVRIV